MLLEDLSMIYLLNDVIFQHFDLVLDVLCIAKEFAFSVSLLTKADIKFEFGRALYLS
jgi:hypothetical protein